MISFHVQRSIYRLETENESHEHQVPVSPFKQQQSKQCIEKIKPSKNHFIAVLCSIYKYYHLQLRERLLLQATISLNLLRQSRTLPHISVYTHIFGEFDFNCTPLAPPGTRIVMHNRPNDCS